MKVLICRPEKDSIDLAEKLKIKNISSVVLPTIDIFYKDASISFDQFDYFIFTSKHAVNALFNKYSSSLLDNKTIYAVGESTANELTNYDVEAIYPKKSNSEELFKLVCDRDLSKIRVALISGVGGNDYLIKELSKLTKCKKIEIYERVGISHKELGLKYQKQYRNNAQPDIIVATSIDVFRSLNKIFEKIAIPKKAIVTITSPKMLEFVKERGFENFLELSKFDNNYICKKIFEILEANNVRV